MGIHDEYLASLVARDDGAPLSELVSLVVGKDLRGRLSGSQAAAHAWFEVNGDSERRHTCGVYLRASRIAGEDPVLGVYVDTNARLTDFRTNKDLYLSRLANSGFRVSDVEFRLSRTRAPMLRAAEVHAGRAHDGAASYKEAEEPLPPLTRKEEAHVHDLTRDLPDGLRQSASRAISLSMRRNKSADTQTKQK